LPLVENKALQPGPLGHRGRAFACGRRQNQRKAAKEPGPGGEKHDWIISLKREKIFPGKGGGGPRVKAKTHPIPLGGRGGRGDRPRWQLGSRPRAKKPSFHLKLAQAGYSLPAIVSAPGSPSLRKKKNNRGQPLLGGPENFDFSLLHRRGKKNPGREGGAKRAWSAGNKEFQIAPQPASPNHRFVGPRSAGKGPLNETRQKATQ